LEALGAVRASESNATGVVIEAFGAGLDSNLCHELGVLASPHERVVCSSRRRSATTYCRDGWGQVLEDGKRVRVHVCEGAAADEAGIVRGAVCYALGEQGVLFIHAAGVARDDLCVLALGDSGAGKSSLTAAGLSAGCRVISDDALMVAGGAEAEPFAVHANRTDIFLNPDAVPLLPESIRRCVGNAAPLTGKCVLSRRAAPAHFLTRGTPTHLLLLDPSHRTADTEIRRASQAEALAALVAACTTLVLSKLAPDAPAMQTALRLVATVPAFHVRVSRDLMIHPAQTLERLLVELRELKPGRAAMLAA